MVFRLKHFIFHIAWLLSIFALGQNQVIDSLENAIKNYGENDTSLVNLRNTYVAKKMLLTPSDSTWLIFNEETLRMAEDLDFRRGQIMANNNIGVVHHYFKSDPLTALDYYQNAFALSENQEKFKKYEYAALTNIALIHYEQEDFDMAMPVFKRLLNYKTRRSNTLSNIANIYALQNELDSSLYYFNRSLEEAYNNNDDLQIANVKSNMGVVQANMGLLDEAITNTKASLKHIDSLNLELLRNTAYINAAEVFLLNDKTDEALSYAELSLKESKALSNLYTQTKSLESLYKIHEKRGDFQQAYTYYRDYQKLNDSLINADRKVELARKEMQFKADKREALARAETKRQRVIKNATILGGSGIFIASLMAFVFYQRKRKALDEIKETEFKALVADIELKALRSQMNPHFIFNSLNSIGDYILKNNSVEASDYLAKFAKLMRLTLENSAKKHISLAQDISLLKTYLDIEKKRFNHRFDYSIEVEDILEIERIVVPPMICQPFVENSVIHGLAPKNGSGHIVVSYTKNDRMVVITIDDNGIGRKAAKAETIGAKTSMGIEITKKRLALLHLKGENQAGYEIIDKNNGTQVVVKLPIPDE